MILIYSDNNEPAPLLNAPLVEHNAERRMRPIYRKMHKVRGKTGWLLCRYGHFFGASRRPDQEGLAHHALQIGEYVYELTREKYRVGQRLSSAQIWPYTIKHAIIGFTDLSDEEIQMQSIKAQSYVRGRNGDKYHMKHNNCQTFIGNFLRRIVTAPLDYNNSEASSLSDTTLISTEKASLEIPSTTCSSEVSASGPEMAMKKTPCKATVAELPAPTMARRDVWKSSHGVTTGVVSVGA